MIFKRDVTVSINLVFSPSSFQNSKLLSLLNAGGEGGLVAVGGDFFFGSARTKSTMLQACSADILSLNSSPFLWSSGGKFLCVNSLVVSKSDPKDEELYLVFRSISWSSKCKFVMVAVEVEEKALVSSGFLDSFSVAIQERGVSFFACFILARK